MEKMKGGKGRENIQKSGSSTRPTGISSRTKPLKGVDRLGGNVLRVEKRAEERHDAYGLLKKVRTSS